MHPFRIKDLERCKVTAPTNPRYPSFYHEVFTAGDEDQFTKDLKKISLVKSAQTPQDNLFAGNLLVTPWEKYTALTSRAVTDTFEYLFYRFKKGILVQIRDGKLVTFLPFSNAAFKNDWAHLIKVDPKYSSLKEFLDYSSKLAGHAPSKILPVNSWFANNSLVRYDMQTRDYSNNLCAFYDMFETLCETRSVPDVDFFLNRRDFPQLTRDGTEPYNHLYGSRTVQMANQRKSYAPIFSCSVSDRYSDIVVPTYEDWMRVVYQETQKYIKHGCKAYPAIKPTLWKSKIKKAVFRGSTTGSGVTEGTNKRLKALAIGAANPDLLDVGITKWNTRPKKHESDVYLRTIERKTYPVANSLTPQEQSQYAYVLNIEGNVAAYRLSYEMSYGSVILLVDSEWKMWFSSFIFPWKHYVPVKADLSDLVEKVEWCKSNDDECVKIARAAVAFYDKYLSSTGILDFLQKTLVETVAITGKYTYTGDILGSQIMEEKNAVEKIIRSVGWVKKHKPPAFESIAEERNVNSLGGLFFGFHGTTSEKVLNQLFKSEKSVVYAVKAGRLTVVKKTALNKVSERENAHESFIGLNVTNRVPVPNFAYVFGPKLETDFRFANVYVEYVHGQTLFQWLTSADFSVNKLLQILVQLNLALQVAQNQHGFIHYDLYPWNVLLVKLDRQKEFSYKVKRDLTLKFRTDFIPVIIDFGKSRAVVYDLKSDSVKDYGLVNLYSGIMILDTVTALISSLVLIDDKAKAKFFPFLEMCGLKDCRENLSHYKKYGKLFSLKDRGLTPLKFVNYVITEFGQMPELKATDKIFRPVGNPLVYYFQTVYSASDVVALETLKRIALATFPRSQTLPGQLYLKAMTEIGVKWLEEFILSAKNENVKTRWFYLKNLMIGPSKLPIDTLDFNLPIPQTVALDESTTPDELAAQNPDPVKGDLVGVLKAYDDMLTLNLYPTEIKARLPEYPFLYLSAAAKINALLSIKYATV